MRIEDGFQQMPHEVGSPYEHDVALQSLLKRLLPSDIFAPVHEDLRRFSKDVAGPIREMAKLADGPSPQLTQYDHRGRRIDRLETSEGWRELKKVAVKERLVAIPYDRPYGRHSRIFSFVKILLWTPDSRVVSCPLSMSDGAAYVLGMLGSDQLKAEWLPRLLSADPQQNVTAGQFMTERAGGSDVSVTETVARPAPGNSDPSQPGSPWLLNGFKWFSSATDGAFALALARTSEKQLSLFLMPLSLANGVRVHRLKQKIGTWALPTAELELNDATGYLLGRVGGGVVAIAPVLNITRVYSAIGSVASLSRALQIATAFASVRVIRNKPLSENVLHNAWLSDLEVTRRACLHLSVNIAALLGAVECGQATNEDELLVRLLTPAAKAFCAHIGTRGILDCIEALGGQGYMEEEGLGRLLRDATVENVWEGTKTVLALDVARVLSSPKRPGLDAFTRWIRSTFEQAVPALGQGHLDLVHASLDLLPQLSIDKQPTLTRQLLDLVAYLASGAYLAQHARWSGEAEDAAVVQQWLHSPGWVGVVEDVKHKLAAPRDASEYASLLYRSKL